MQSVAAFAIAALIGASTFVAVRLLVLHRRTRAWPELLLGAMLLLSVGVGYPMHIASIELGDPLASLLASASGIAIAAGFSLLFVFTWRVFRPDATWARVFAAAGVCALVVRALHACVVIHGRGVLGVAETPASEMLAQTLPVLIGYVWTAWESLRYHAVMRRRVRLGLAEREVSDRFLLWGLAALAASAGVLLNTVAGVLQVDVFESPAVLIGSSFTGLSQAALLVMAFVPPRWYLRRVRERAAGSAS